MGHAHGHPAAVGIAALDQDPDVGGRAAAALAAVLLVGARKHPDLEVEQTHFAEPRIKAAQSLADGLVQGVDRAPARGGRVLGQAADLDHHRSLGQGLLAFEHVVVEHPVARDREVAACPAEHPVEQQLVGGLGRRVFVAFGLALLDGGQKLQDEGVVFIQVETEFPGLVKDVALAREVGQQHPPDIAHGLRGDVLVGEGVFHHGADMDAGLVGKGAVAHVGLVGTRRLVDRLRDEVGQGRERGQPALGQAGNAHLEFQGRDDRAQVGVAAALAVAVDGALDLLGAEIHAFEDIGHGQARVVVRVDPETHPGQGGHGRFHDPAEVPGQGTAVGVA